AYYADAREFRAHQSQVRDEAVALAAQMAVETRRGQRPAPRNLLAEWFGNGAPKPTATNQPTVPPGTFQLTEADREVARACGLSDEEMVTTKVRDFMRNAERQGFTPTPQGNTMYQATLTEADRQVARQFGL